MTKDSLPRIDGLTETWASTSSPPPCSSRVFGIPPWKWNPKSQSKTSHVQLLTLRFSLSFLCAVCLHASVSPSFCGSTWTPQRASLARQSLATTSCCCMCLTVGECPISLRAVSGLIDLSWFQGAFRPSVTLLPTCSAPIHSGFEPRWPGKRAEEDKRWKTRTEAWFSWRTLCSRSLFRSSTECCWRCFYLISSWCLWRSELGLMKTSAVSISRALALILARSSWSAFWKMRFFPLLTLN